MKNDIKNLFEKNFDFVFKAATYHNIKIAIQAFEQFIKKNETFFSFNKKETLYGHLRTYVIEKQFNDSAFNPKANYSVSMKQVNNYKYKALCIETKDFIVNLGRTSNENILLPASSYKKDFAKANTNLETQLTFDFNNEIPQIVPSKKYAEIIYGYKYGNLTHLRIVLPSGNYKNIEHSIDLLEDIKIYDNYVPEELVEESIVSLKKSLLNEADKAI